MAGELNGTNVILSDGTGEIVGQMEMTLTFNGTPIDISNKSYQDWTTLLDGELATKGTTIAGTLVYNSDAQYQKVRADSITGTQDTYTLDFTNGETWAGVMVPNGLSDALPHGDKVATTLNFLSSGVVTRTPIT